MANRRQFLGTLGRIMGGGVLLPIAGRGAFSIDSANAAQLPVTAVPLPVSAECLELRSLKRAFLANRLDQIEGHQSVDQQQLRYTALRHQQAALVAAMIAKPTTWAHAAELAEVAWHMAPKEDILVNGISVYTGHLSTTVPAWGRYALPCIQRQVTAALIEAVVTLGGGERFDHHLEAHRHG